MAGSALRLVKAVLAVHYPLGCVRTYEWRAGGVRTAAAWAMWRAARCLLSLTPRKTRWARMELELRPCVAVYL